MPRWKFVLSLVFFTLPPAVRAVEPLDLPTRPIIELRARIQAVLANYNTHTTLDRSISLGVGRARSGLIALEEAALWLDLPSAVHEARIDQVLAFAERMLLDARLSDEDRDSLSGYLDLHLKLRSAHGPIPVLRMLEQHRLWGPRHLAYIIEHVNDVRLRRLTYRALVDLYPSASALDRALLEDELAKHPSNILDLRAMLDEFGTLPAAKYAALLKALQRDFTELGKVGGPYYEIKRLIRMRAVERIQSRLAAGDEATRVAFEKASFSPGDGRGREFYRRLKLGLLRFDYRDQNLKTADPLGLAVHEETTSNVVNFCPRLITRRAGS